MGCGLRIRRMVVLFGLPRPGAVRLRPCDCGTVRRRNGRYMCNRYKLTTADGRVIEAHSDSFSLRVEGATHKPIVTFFPHPHPDDNDVFVLCACGHYHTAREAVDDIQKCL